MSDGSNFGYNAEAALKAVLGSADDDAKPDDNLKTPDGMAAYLDGATLQWDTYEEAARDFGKIVLDFLRTYPEAINLDAHEIYDRVRTEEIGAAGLSGFMVGWGVNAARFAVSMPQVQNPAIIDL